MRRSWRIFRYLTAVIGYTAVLWVRLRRMPAAEQAAYRAYWQRRASQAFCRILHVNVRVRGTIPATGGLLVGSNHISFFDPFLLASHLRVAFVGKAELRDWPVGGWVCRTVGLIFVERDRRMATNQFVEAVQARLQEGVWVLAFPEGTTNHGPDVRRFKTGAFEAVAGQAEEGVLPVYLHLKAVEGQPVDRAARLRFTWSDETPKSFGQHLWDLAGIRDADVELWVGPVVPAEPLSRKGLAQAAEAAVQALAEAAASDPEPTP